MADLTLPGDIPGLLRRGSPVHAGGLARGCGSVVVSVSARGAVIAFTQEWEGGAPGGGDLLEDYAVSTKLRDLVLDLSDPTGRAHAAWWLRSQPAQYGTNWPGFIASSRPFVAQEMRGVTGPGRLFEDLDPDDPRTLPDGSRWVDAEALRRIVLHIAGRTDND